MPQIDALPVTSFHKPPRRSTWEVAGRNEPFGSHLAGIQPILITCFEACAWPLKTNAVYVEDLHGHVEA